MWTSAPREPEVPSLEEIRKRARILVIDDKELPQQRLFTRDGYHMQRWPRIENVSQLTDNHFDLILLDMQGVGLRESPQRQGLGILQHIKQTNPTQLVIAYSAENWNVSNRDFFALADAAMDKGQDYIDFKSKVDELLTKRYTYGYFISKMNQSLGEYAADAPDAVRHALKAMQRGTTSRLHSYLNRTLNNAEKVDKIITIIAAGIKVFEAVHK